MANNKKTINATPLVEKLEFLTGVSSKSGNEYMVGAVHLKSPVSDTPIRIGFDYIDPNTKALIEMSFDKFADQIKTDFKDEVQA